MQRNQVLKTRRTINGTKVKVLVDLASVVSVGVDGSVLGCTKTHVWMSTAAQSS